VSPPRRLGGGEGQIVIADDLDELPGDPFDRMLTAQPKVEGYDVVSDPG